MSYDLRPLSVTEIFDRAFRILRDHFSLFVGIWALISVPTGLLQALWNPAKPFAPVVAIPLLLISLLLILAAPIVYAASTSAVVSVYLDRPLTISGAFQETRPIVTQLIGTLLLVFLFVVLAALLLVIPAIYLGITWALVTQVAVVERRFGMAALRRSHELVRGSWWKTFGIIFVAVLIGLIPGIVVGTFASSIPFIGTISKIAVQPVASSFSAVVHVVYYFDRRCRTEHVDLGILAEQVRLGREAGHVSVPDPSPLA
jgi:hypothetical protein